MFHTADPDDIIEGTITDVYFERSLKILPNGRMRHAWSCGSKFEVILIPVLDNGKYLIKTDTPAEIRKYVLHNLKDVSLT